MNHNLRHFQRNTFRFLTGSNNQCRNRTDGRTDGRKQKQVLST